LEKVRAVEGGPLGGRTQEELRGIGVEKKEFF